MIFVTVGTQLAFPRLIAAMDRFAATSDEEVIAQTGTEDTAYSHLTVRPFMDPVSFDEAFTRARLVVAHAGIGSILSAKRHARPLIVMPRRLEFGEHRNDHQLATARALEDNPGLYVAWAEDDLFRLLGDRSLTPPKDHLGPQHSALVEGISGFLKSVESRRSETVGPSERLATGPAVRDAK